MSEALLDRRDVRLAIAKRVRRRVDRVVAGDEIVLVRSGRAENELGVGQRFKIDRFARRLESREVPVPQFVNDCASEAQLRLKQFASKLVLYCASGSSSLRAATSGATEINQSPTQPTKSIMRVALRAPKTNITLR